MRRRSWEICLPGFYHEDNKHEKKRTKIIYYETKIVKKRVKRNSQRLLI
jgi:hypothetical protein